MKEKFRQPEQAIRLFFWLFAAVCLLAAIAMPDRGQMVEGMLRLCTLPYQSANSYFDAANGGFAGTFLNAAIVCAVCAAIYSLPGSKPDGVSVLAYFLTAGFCFWGITVLNIWFCFAGVLISCLIRKVKFYTQGNVFLFSTGIAPLMTDLLIRYPGAESRGVTLFGAVLTLLVCTVIGLILPAGLAHSPKVHKGYDLYSAAVPVGLTAFFLRAVLYRVLGGTLPDGVGVGAGDGNWAVCNIFCIAVFVLALVLGLGLGASFRQYGELLKDSGFGVDYRLDTPAEIAKAFHVKQELGLKGGMLVTNPIPDEYSMDPAVINTAIDEAVKESVEQGIKGKKITPFLLDRVQKITGGNSLEANIQLVFNNAHLAAKTAVELSKLAK